MQLSFRVADRREVVRVFFPAASAAALALMLVGCGGDGAAKFDSSLRDAPCEVVTAETVAGVFGLPVEEIEQHSAMGMCTYNWKGDGQVLDATIHVTRVSESAAAAAEYFGRATAGLSGAELDAAMNSVREQARKQAGEAGGTTDAILGAAGEASSSGSRGIQFRDVPGIGDQARMQVGKGDLNILYGNLFFSVSAYHGAPMSFADGFPGASGLVAASNAWMAEVLPQREEQSIELARAALATL